ncbi:YqiA/YcfP family alpha/beta fold hydrolase [Leptospira alstonii]|uniref:Alpha/beta hydrolase family protein n=2 Tax=Leptospira alstonii TaxID=28452 RepID=M6D1Y1_9LEPT|nr:alpha/beta hydrolase [Leptospira alstonii]EMJ96706.1 hypothetical protein LEP1GSC194_4309 [Leptospira alstonii serovar Sichuan str. 79601]EQA78821.1 hypothetical protein LEP1GSC193_1695 [Leptospira alstonii serovar Pingchang str. 80-412]
MKRLYLISGLGADERAFKNLDFGKNDLKYISWIDPQANEEVSNYCKRLSEQISKAEDIILIGVSFGGIIAIELSKIVSVKKVIIISSIKSKMEMPKIYQFISILGIIKIVPAFIYKIYTPILSYLFGINSDEDKKLLKDFIKSTNAKFMKWALSTILKWNNRQVSDKITHIHGDKDKLFPIGLIRNALIIKNGGHFMILNKSGEISFKLKELLAN